MENIVKQKQTSMNDVQIFVDTNMDITPEYAKENNLYLLQTTTFKNDELLTAYLNTPYNLDEYYEEMRESKNKYNTAAIPPAGYEEAFSKAFDEGKDILYLHFSGACSSAAMNNINIVKRDLEDKYPENKIYLVDTKQVCAGGRLIIDNILNLIKDGKSLEEILEWCELEIPHFALYFAVNDIQYMRRSGRVSKASATFGAMLNIKPIAKIKDDGIIEVFDKVKGDKASIRRMLKYAVETANKENLLKHGIVICDSGNNEMADMLEEAFKTEYGSNLNVVRTKINPVIGVHSGPGAYGVSFYANHR